jgi:hypothetical protein
MLSPKQFAVAEGETRYYGAFCDHHPDMLGLRRTCDSKCIGCTRIRDSKRIRHSRHIPKIVICANPFCDVQIDRRISPNIRYCCPEHRVKRIKQPTINIGPRICNSCHKSEIPPSRKYCDECRQLKAFQRHDRCNREYQRQRSMLYGSKQINAVRVLRAMGELPPLIKLYSYRQSLQDHIYYGFYGYLSDFDKANLVKRYVRGPLIRPARNSRIRLRGASPERQAALAEKAAKAMQIREAYFKNNSVREIRFCYCGAEVPTGTRWSTKTCCAEHWIIDYTSPDRARRNKPHKPHKKHVVNPARKPYQGQRTGQPCAGPNCSNVIPIGRNSVTCCDLCHAVRDKVRQANSDRNRTNRGRVGLDNLSNNLLKSFRKTNQKTKSKNQTRKRVRTENVRKADQIKGKRTHRLRMQAMRRMEEWKAIGLMDDKQLLKEMGYDNE